MSKGKVIRHRLQGVAFLATLLLLLGLAVALIDLFLSLAIWGSTTTVRIAG